MWFPKRTSQFYNLVKPYQMNGLKTQAEALFCCSGCSLLLLPHM